MKTLMQRCLLTVFFLLMTSLGVKAQEWTCYSPESATLTYDTGGDVVVNNGILTATGAVQLSDITDKLSADIAVADIAAVSGLSGATLPTANPNLLIYAKEGAVSNTKNVIVDGTCQNLELSPL